MELDAEIFAVGKWNGMEFTEEDLGSIAATFATLGDKMRVALKLGHNDEQQMTDGHPALGWVSKVWVAGDKLMARFTDMPQVVIDAIKKKLYKNVSVELDMDVKHKDSQYPYVLTGVALLGADIPAVNTLKDLAHYMSRDADFSVGRTVVFSAIAGINQDEGGNMELKEALDKISELSAINATLTAGKAAAEETSAKFAAEKAASDAQIEKARIEMKRTEVAAIFEEGVKNELITPAQREQFSKLLKLNDDKAVDALDVADVKALVTGGKKFDFGRSDQGKQGSSGEDSRAPDVILAERAQILVDTKEAADLIGAQAMVFRRDPDLARAYIQQNGRK